MIWLFTRELAEKLLELIRVQQWGVINIKNQLYSYKQGKIAIKYHFKRYWFWISGFEHLRCNHAFLKFFTPININLKIKLKFEHHK